MRLDEPGGECRKVRLLERTELYLVRRKIVYCHSTLNALLSIDVIRRHPQTGHRHPRRHNIRKLVEAPIIIHWYLRLVGKPSRLAPKAPAAEEDALITKAGVVRCKTILASKQRLRAVRVSLGLKPGMKLQV